MTRTLAIELGKYGITVNAVAPGFVVIEMTRHVAQRAVAHRQFLEDAGLSKCLDSGDRMVRSDKCHAAHDGIARYARPAARQRSGLELAPDRHMVGQER